ncbi:uncharacterized protein RCH25_042705 [Pelodytes ibericus]
MPDWLRPPSLRARNPGLCIVRIEAARDPGHSIAARRSLCDVCRFPQMLPGSSVGMAVKSHNSIIEGPRSQEEHFHVCGADGQAQVNLERKVFFSKYLEEVKFDLRFYPICVYNQPLNGASEFQTDSGHIADIKRHGKWKLTRTAAATRSLGGNSPESADLMDFEKELLQAMGTKAIMGVLGAYPNCASDEISNSATSTCDCNSNNYTSSATPPAPVIQCNDGYLNLYISKCQLEKSKFNSSNLYLNDNTCSGTPETVNGTSEIAFHPLLKTGACGNTVQTNGTHVTYSNTLFINPKVATIVSRSKFNVSFSCSFPLNFTVALNVTLKPIIGTTQLVVPQANAVFTVNMMAFTDDQFSKPLTASSILYVEDTIYLSVSIPNLAADSFALKVLRIFASPTDDVTGPLYDLLSGGCPDQTVGAGLVSVIENGETAESRFKMNVFQIADSLIVNIYAVVTICEGTCIPVCTGAKSADVSENVATVSVLVTANVSATCADDEYASTNGACVCNSTLYTTAVSPPAPLVNCSGGTMKVYLSKCQLEKNKYNSSNVHLNDPNCTASNDIIDGKSQLTFTQQLKMGYCNNTVIANNSYVSYTNTLHISPSIGTIIARNSVNVTFTCTFPLNFSVALNTTLKPIIGTSQITVPDTNAVLEVTMAVYKDENFNQLLSSTDTLYVEDDVYVSVFIPYLEASVFSVKVVRIYATASPYSTGQPQYDLLNNGCPVLQNGQYLVNIFQNGNTTEARFAMKAFKIASADSVSLFAEVTICGGTCIQVSNNFV